MSRPDTKELILDTAERLFARDGYHGTSLRTITSEAGVNLAAVHYHFGSKEALIDAVFARRMEPLNAIRLKRLDEVRQQAERESARPDVRQALRAFIEPTVAFRETGAGAENFVILVGRILAEPDETVRMMFVERILPVFMQLFETLCQALPEIDRNQLFWRLHFALGALSHTLCWMGRFTILPEGLVPTCNGAVLSEMLVEFAAAGIEVRT